MSTQRQDPENRGESMAILVTYINLRKIPGVTAGIYDQDGPPRAIVYLMVDGLVPDHSSGPNLAVEVYEDGYEPCFSLEQKPETFEAGVFRRLAMVEALLQGQTPLSIKQKLRDAISLPTDPKLEALTTDLQLI